MMGKHIDMVLSAAPTRPFGSTATGQSLVTSKVRLLPIIHWHAQPNALERLCNIYGLSLCHHLRLEGPLCRVKAAMRADFPPNA
jgi:hypothetical protein